MPKLTLLTAILLLAGVASSHASFVYDFPGTPGSLVAANQTVPPQDGHATFSDWTRVNLGNGVGTSDVLDSNFWNTTAIFDPTQYESFTITADAGYHLDLQLLTFDQTRIAGGPTKGRISMFLNGSVVAYDTFDYNPTASWQNKTDAFVPTVDADNVTLVEFQFYGWNGGTADASLLIDNVTITVAIVPEPAIGALVDCFVGLAVLHSRRGCKGKGHSRC